MKHYCENTYCETEATKRVRVSENRPGSSFRWLCGACEEVFTWGVQHGSMAGKKEADARVRDQRRESDRIIMALRACLRVTRGTIRGVLKGGWDGNAEGWECAIAHVDQTLAASRPEKEKVTP